MPNRDKTGRLGKGKDCDETATKDRMGGGRGRRRPAQGRGRNRK